MEHGHRVSSITPAAILISKTASIVTVAMYDGLGTHILRSRAPALPPYVDN